MRNAKKGIIIPFSGNSNNEAVKTNTNSVIDSDIGSFNGSAAAKVNIDNAIDNAIVHDEAIKNKNNKEIKISDELLLNVSDSLKTPINVIHGAAQLMELNIENNFEEINYEKATKSINTIKQNCLRLTKHINNLMDLLKIETEQFSLNLSNVNIVDVVDNIVENISCIIKEKQLNIIFDTDDEEKIVSCDAEKIERVVLNLVSNAVMFSKPGANIFVRITSKYNKIEITVSYEGTGMDKQYLDSKNEQCNGVELHLSKSILELHGGNLISNVTENDVSSFTIELPCQNTDFIYSLYNKGSIMNYENLITMINIEFSDINNTGWN